MRWLIVLCAVVLLGALICGLAKSEELTTTNLVPGMSGFTASGGTSVGSGSGCGSGAYCTSGTNQGGGSYTSTFAVPLTEAEVKLGFTLNSAITINSHISNSQLATCSSVTQSGDCRDIFKLTISLLDSGTQVQSFTHQEELTWAGLKDFTFTDTVAANSYGVLTGMLELYGIDAGYPTGFYGPQFVDGSPSLTIDYQTALIQQHVEQEIQQLIEQTAVVQMVELLPPPATVAETTAAPPPVTDIAPPPVTDIAPPTMTATIAPPAAPTIAPISPPQTEAQQAQEAQAEAQIEAAVEAQPEATAEAQPEPEAAEAQTQQAAAPAPTKTAPKAAATPKARMTPAVAAQTVVDNIAPSQRYGLAAQTTTLVAMGMIGGNRTLFKSAGIADAAVGFFSTATIQDGPSIVDTLTNYRFSGQASAAHNALVESQWSK